MTKRTPLLLMLLAGLATCAPDERGQGLARVIVITCDTLRADRLGCYGYERPTSPRLDELARQGLLFENAYATAPHTNPALASLFTSRLPDELGVSGGNRMLLPEPIVTLAEIASRSGIATAAVVSNWALRRAPDGAGDVGLAQGFAHYDDRMGSPEANRVGQFERLAPDTTNAAIDWLEQHGRGADRFLLWVHYQDPHGPYTPPPELARAFERPAGDEPQLPLGERHDGYRQIPAYQVLDGERRPGFYSDRYDAEIAFFDRELGRLLDHLADTGLDRDALIVFTSDHGESLGEHEYWFCHEQHVFHEAVHVPLILRAPPGRLPSGPGARSEALVSHLDLLPTILGAFDLPSPPARGLDLLVGEPPAGRIVPHTLGVEGSPGRWVGVSDGRHRLLTNVNGLALFDRRADPAELVNLATSDRDRAADMWQRYLEFLAAIEPLPAQRPVPSPLDEDSRRALQALGYVEDGER
jgi:arylsulfatase